MASTNKEKVQDRPKPPLFSEIIEDVEKAGDDDVVFNVDNDGHKNSLAMVESFIEVSTLDEKLADGDGVNNQTELNVDQAYSDTLELLNCQENLENASDLLQKKFESIEQMGKEVSLSILELQQSAKTILTES